MKVQVLQENLSEALSFCSRFAGSRIQLPVLANILLKTNKNKLLVASTNLEISVSISIGAKVTKEGEITVPARTITDVVSNLGAGQINIEVDKELVKVTTNDFESSISGMNSADFPVIPHELGLNSLQLPSKDFTKALSNVLFAVSNDETRPVLTGVLTIFKSNEITLVATDGFRLSQKKLQLKGDKEEKRVILPKNALSELSRLSGAEDSIAFSFKKNENQVLLGVGNSTLATRVIEGEFPDFERIIPKETKIKVFVDKEELLRAVKLASVFARDAGNVVKVFIREDSIELSAESQTSGSQKTKVEAKVETDILKKGTDFVIAFNYRFLEEFLNTVGGEEVQLELSDPNAPALFLDPKDTNFLHIIMPVRLQP